MRLYYLHYKAAGAGSRSHFMALGKGRFFEAVDVLFVDEAGQLSLIDTIAVSQAAKNIILLGDILQLKQPVQGIHPEGTEIEQLEHKKGYIENIIFKYGRKASVKALYARLPFVQHSCIPQGIGL